MGIGKLKTLTAPEKKTLTTTREDIMFEATEFVGLCYNITKRKDMFEKRYSVLYFPMFQKSRFFYHQIIHKTQGALKN